MMRKSKAGKQPGNNSEQLLKTKSALLTRLQHELKIEASLEKVRKVAMSMKNPEDMLSICKTISQQLAGLGVKEIRNVQTAIFYESRVTYMNYEYYAKHDKTSITETTYNNNRIHKAFAIKMLKGRGQVFISHIKGKKVKEWLAYQKTTNVFIDKYLNTASSLNYYWHSLGPVALGISTYAPLKKEELELFQRFLKVFELAFRRHLDIEKANAQAREAQIEAALERIRASAMAMRDSSALSGIIFKVYGELTKLDAKLDRCFIMIVNPDNKGITWWLAGKEGLLAENGFFIQPSQHPTHLMYLDHWKKRKKKWQYLFEGKEKREWDKFGFSKTELARLPEFIKKDMAGVKKIHLSGSSDQFGSLVTGSLEPLPEEQQDIINRFTIAFNQAYIRFLDLQKAEAQAKEAETELGLERVRARAMAMQHSDELAELVATVFRELNKLGLSLASCIIWIHSPADKSNALWIASEEMNKPARPLQIVPFYEPFFTSIIAAWKAKDPKWIFSLTGTEKKKFQTLFFKNYPELPEGLKKPVTQNKQITFSASFNNFGALEIVATEPLTDDKFEILHRFGNVFNTSYTRFNDLQKAEQQAREAQIQLALERVRARTMAMQKSDELPEAANLLFQQVQALGMPAWSAGYCIWAEDKKSVTLWMSSEGVLQPPFNAPTTEDELFIQMRKGHENGKELHVVEMGGKKLEAHYRYMRTLPVVGEIFDSILAAGHPLPGFQVMHYAYFSKGYLLFITYEPVPDAHDIFKRFAAVFEQTYTRFLDLKKAEAQTREAQIELALERIRARTMAMHKSDEIIDIMSVMFAQFAQLNIRADVTGLNLDYKNDTLNFWMGIQGQTYPEQLKVPYVNLPFINRIYEAAKNNKEFISTGCGKEEKNLWVHHLFEHTVSKYAPEETKKFLLEAPGLNVSLAMGNNVAFIAGNYSTIPFSEEENAVIKRFKNVFEQSYTRFIDLQKAEAQAREAQIEAALERVRSRTMAMHKSDELPETSHILFEQMKELGEPVEQLTIGIVNEENNVVEISATLLGDTFKKIYSHSVDEPYMMAKVYKAWKKQQKTLIVELRGDELNAYNQYRNELTNSKMFPTNLGKEHQRIVYAAFFSKGMLAFGANEKRPPESLQLLVKFASVFDLTYTRFLDLQKAEAQAREAQIETALEKVRSRSLAMHKSEELSELVAVLYEKMNELGVSSDGININVIKEGAKSFESWLAAPGQSYAVCFHVPYFNHPVIDEIMDAVKTQKELLTKVYSFEEKTSFFSYLYNNTDFRQLPEDRKKMILESKNWEVSIAFARNTALSLHSYSGKIFSNEENEILKRFAKVFEQSYTRFLDLQKAEAQAEIARLNLIQIQEEKQRAEDALAELQVTQKQLIQSEKMASLGELTAGIAHEIQNPLNFVNNFSEVSKELLDEMKEAIEKGDTEEAKEIMNDVIQNLDKINHHGKRADGIVKGMLQHSRTGSGQKERTDINALCDEYLRLSYHGLRAKDKTFNAKFETRFDETVGNINVMPQDIGRVILNLINNAFYAVSEKKKQDIAGYEPTVTVGTKKDGDIVSLCVRDNGNGIPQKVLDKIFQPFFTTKPAGQGTGLGLSLSYDIVKAHGGEIKVSTKPGEGTEFIIILNCH